VADRGYDDTLRKADCLPLTILNLLVLSTLLTSQACGTSMISDVRDARRIVPWLADNGATVWNGVPPQLYDLVHDSSIDGPALDGLQEVWSGGDNLHEDVRTGFAAKFSPPICGTYGLTEAPTVVSIEKRGAVHAPGCSGIVLPHLRVTVDHLDELCVAARDDGPFAGLYTPMLGYWNNPEETSAALEGGVLRTGDIGTVTDAGELYVRDRRKLVIVRGGANVYPAEVEKALAAVPGVVAAALLAVPDERLGERVGAVVQITRPGAVDVDALVAHCRERLSRYKVPERWHLTDEPLPRNAMGKIDRTRLAPLLVDEQPG
jgi:acyl-CoA synthetase (AMP-forming)/AMP-acid ligase II